MYRIPTRLIPSVARSMLRPAAVTPACAQRRTYAKELKFGAEARRLMLQGVDTLTDAVAITMGPKVRSI